LFLSAGVELDIRAIDAELRWTTDALAWSRSKLWLDVDSHSRCLAGSLVTVVGSRIAAKSPRGGFAFDEVEWLEAERLPYEGGLAAKLVLGRWLKGGTHAVEPLNGVELRSLSMRANAICICGQVGWASIPPADCGIPVLGGSVDGSPDTLADGRIGILVDPDEGEALYEALFS